MNKCTHFIVEASSQPELCLVQTPGVQIFGLQTAAAPRRRDPRVPILETYGFVSNKRVVAAKPDLQDYLARCSLAAHQSLTRLAGSGSTLPVPNVLIAQLNHEYENRQRSCDIDGTPDVLPKNSKFALLDYLQRLKKGCGISADEPWDMKADEPWDMKDDLLLTDVLSPDHLKPAIDIVIENSVSNKLRITELTGSLAVRLYTRVLDYCDNAVLVKTDYTLWVPAKSTLEYEDSRIVVEQKEYGTEQLSAKHDHHLVLLSNVMQVGT